MADENLPPEDESGIDADALASEVASDSSDQDLADEWAAAMSEAGEGPEEEEDVPKAPLEKLMDESKGPGQSSPDLDVILDIPVSIAMEVGRTDIPIRNLLQLNQGSVIELDRLAGEPLDVLVNGTLIAHGEVVMVNEKFGIRLTDVVSQQERINRLR
ncbi:flagellar motor switch protein FliN [Salinispirillum marinum]|uniref:Flagellar motor switch protein FliN n=2 Tax=Saccharospirillaceae TaxID=255527 RepID=A0ABV8BES9_9GAMM